jgi:hypothetical protein
LAYNIVVEINAIEGSAHSVESTAIWADPVAVVGKGVASVDIDLG